MQHVTGPAYISARQYERPTHLYRVVVVCYTFVQASQLCTNTRAKKSIVGLAVVAVCVGCFLTHRPDLIKRDYVILSVIYFAFYAIVPVSVLIINVVLIREVRRAANNAAANLGVQQHHQSTSSNSAVPTVMLISTSLLYVLLRGSVYISAVSVAYLPYSYDMWQCNRILVALAHFLYAYNFYVYLITGKQFRSELRTLFCRSSCSSSSSAATAAARDRNDVELEKTRTSRDRRLKLPLLMNNGH